MSHRTHHGHLGRQHTEREFGWPVVWALVALGTACIAIALTSCATTSVQCANLERGACTVTSTRLLTDSGVSLGTPDGLALSFSSKPNEAGTAAAFKALGGTIDLLGKLVAAKAVPDQPTTPTVPPVVVPPPPPPPAMLEAPDL